MPEDLGDKTEAPTAKKLFDARQRGQVPKSTDLSAAAGLFAAALAMAVLGPGWAERAAISLRRTLSMDLSGPATDHGAVVSDIIWAMGEAALIVGPVMALLLLAGYISQLGQVGFLLSGKPLQPKLNRMNPLQGAKRIVGKKNLGKSGINILKLSIVIAVTTLLIGRVASSIITLPMLPLPAVAAELARKAAELVAWLLALLLAMGVLDYVWQRWNHHQELKMTKQEVKDERKSIDGDPFMKQRQQQFMRDIARQRINAAVPQADVIVTNPTHYAVALKYDAEAMGAPKVIAKGVDYLAWRIRQIARMHDVPIVERPPLARALYGGVNIGEEVRPEHYEAVAEILAYVYRLRQQEQAA